MKKPVYISVDAGATNIKMLAAEFDGQRIKCTDSFQTADPPAVKNGHEYVDTDRILSVIREGILKFKESSLPVSLGIDTFGNGYGITDQRGVLTEEPHFYRDGRIDHIREHIHRYYTDRQLYDMTGNFPIKTRGLFHLYQDVLEKSDGIRFGERLLPLPSLLEYMITGETGSERTMASVLYMLDRNGENWNFELFRRIGIPEKLFGPLQDPGIIRGKIAEEFSGTDQIAGIPVACVAGHDTESALIAAPGLDRNSAFISLGTSFIFGARTDAPVINDKSYENGFKNMRGAFGTFSLCRDFPGFWILERCMEQWRKEIPALDYEGVSEAVKAAGHGKAFIDIGDDRFRVSEGNILEVIRDYCLESGQKPPEGISETAASLFGSYARYLKKCVEELQQVTGVRYRKLIAVNGGVRNRLLMQMFADTLGMPVVAGSPYASALGNLLIQLYASGEISSAEDISEIAGSSTEPVIYESKSGGNGWTAG